MNKHMDNLELQVESLRDSKKKKEQSPSISRLVSLFEGPEEKSMDVDKTEVVAGKDLSKEYMTRGRRILIPRRKNSKSKERIVVTRIDDIFKKGPAKKKVAGDPF